MNWYKTSQIEVEKSVEDREPIENLKELSEYLSDHNYHASDDYETIEDDELNELNGEEQQAAELTKIIAKKLNEDLMPQLRSKGVGLMEISFVNLEEDNILGKYVNGTYGRPVFVIDIANIISGSLMYDVPQDVAIETTLLHEIGHAIQDANRLELNEELAEDFAEHYHYNRKILDIVEMGEGDSNEF